MWFKREVDRETRFSVLAFLGLFLDSLRPRTAFHNSWQVENPVVELKQPSRPVESGQRTCIVTLNGLQVTLRNERAFPEEYLRLLGMTLPVCPVQESQYFAK